MEFFINTEVYEDLTKENNSDKYEFILPNFNLSKVLETGLNGTIEIMSSGYNKLFETIDTHANFILYSWACSRENDLINIVFIDRVIYNLKDILI